MAPDSAAHMSAHGSYDYVKCIFFVCLCVYACPAYKSKSWLVCAPFWRKSLVGVSGLLPPRSSRHHPHLYGPADYCCHCQQKGAQTKGVCALMLMYGSLNKIVDDCRRDSKRDCVVYERVCKFICHVNYIFTFLGRGDTLSSVNYSNTSQS